MEGEGRVESGRWPLWKRPRATLNFLISIKRAPNPEGEEKGGEIAREHAQSASLPPSLNPGSSSVRGENLLTPHARGRRRGWKGVADKVTGPS